jgi:pyrroline-5-carboxylate reductase
MPNTPALLGCGVSALFANPQTNAQQRAHAEAILTAVGSCSWVEEEGLLDAVAALSGSGPAYLFYFLEAMVDAGVALGLQREAATRMALDTALGAARMALEGGADLAELRRRVTSPGGTTEAAIASFSDDDLHAVVARAMQAASDRAAVMARELG